MRGFVYILSNPSMPGIVKIGRTTRSVDGRAAELYQTGVPTPFAVEHSVYSPDCAELEREAHNLLADLRVDPSREFFRCDVELAVGVLNDALAEQVLDYVYEYAPGFTLVEEPFFVDPGDIARACGETELHPYEFACVVRFLDPGAVQEAANRWQAHRAKIAEARKQAVVEF